MITVRDIEEARARIAESIFQSPCAYSETFSRATGLRAAGYEHRRHLM